MFSSSQLSFRSSNRRLVQEKGNDSTKKLRCRGVQPIFRLPSSFFHKYFLVAHPWPFQSLSRYMFLFLQPTRYGRRGLGELSNGQEKQPVKDEDYTDHSGLRSRRTTKVSFQSSGITYNHIPFVSNSMES